MCGVLALRPERRLKPESRRKRLWRGRGDGAEANSVRRGASALRGARYSLFMPAEIIFSGGERVLVPSANADEVMAKMTTEGSRDHQAMGGARVRPGAAA